MVNKKKVLSKRCPAWPIKVVEKPPWKSKKKKIKKGVLPKPRETWRLHPGSRSFPICNCGRQTKFFVKAIELETVAWRLCSRCDEDLIREVKSRGYIEKEIVSRRIVPPDTAGFNSEKYSYPFPGRKVHCCECRHLDQSLSQCLINGKKIDDPSSERWCNKFGRKGL